MWEATQLSSSLCTAGDTTSLKWPYRTTDFVLLILLLFINFSVYNSCVKRLSNVLAFRIMLWWWLQNAGKYEYSVMMNVSGFLRVQNVARRIQCTRQNSDDGQTISPSVLYCIKQLYIFVCMCACSLIKLVT